jgi:hypothetical protein
MSSGQAVGAIVGGVVGFVVGGPTGAVYGAQAGIAVGGALDPPKGPTIEGPRLNDLTVQTSTYGQFIPRTYGTIGLSGNVFWLENNALKEVVKKKKSGGKGGGSSSTVKTYSYFATFAVGLCEGPIAGVRRIWVGPDLFYDAGSDDLGTIIASNGAASKFTIYLGADTQQPDPRIQAEIGVANTSAYRGLAYIVMKDFALAKYGNSVAGAQVKVEVVNFLSESVKLLSSNQAPGPAPAGPYRTHMPYVDSSGNAAIFKDGEYYQAFPNGSSRFIRRVAAAGGSGGFQVYADRPIHAWLPVSTIEIVDDQGAALASFNHSGMSQLNSYLYIYGGNGYAIKYEPSITTIYTFNLLGFQTLTSVYSSSAADRIYDIFPYDGFIYALTVNKQVRKLDLSFSVLWSVDMSPVSMNLFWSGGNRTILRTSENDTVTLVTIGNDHSFYSVSALGYFYKGAATVGESFGALGGHVKIGSMWYTLNSKPTEDKITYVSISEINTLDASLSAIVAAEASRSNLIKPADINTTGLTDAVTGFKVTATGSIRNAIEPLRGAWPFDVVQSGYQIKATSRGSDSVVTIPVGELAIDTQLTESREMDSQLPQNVTVKYIDQGRDYDVNEQRAQRDNTEAVNSLSIDLPVVLSASEAAQVADKLIRIYALEKSDFSFTLPAPYRYLEPGDVITIETDDASFVLRLVSVNHTADGRLECAGRPSSASAYVSIVPGASGQGGSVTIPLAGATVGTLIDCPVIDEGLQDAPGFAAAFNGYSSDWPGGILYQTADEGQTWTDLQAIQGQATAGTATGVLSVSAGNLVQVGGTLTVSLISGTLESVTEAQMFNGANFAAYGQPGRWEVLRFQNATLVSAGVYTLDTFWRGDRGTEWATGLHVAGDQFILMTDPDLAFVGMPTDTIGQPRIYRSITADADIDSAADQAFTYAGVNLETYSGVHPVGSRSANDLTVIWQRRTRVGGAWRDNVDASLGESVQAYEVDIMQGAVVKRTLAASTPSVLYTSAMQVADFGSNQSSVAVNIYQLSSVVGRGYPLGATL